MNGEGDILPRMVDATPGNISPPFCKTYLLIRGLIFRQDYRINKIFLPFQKIRFLGFIWTP